ncbi:zinc ABC transporter substrate-binding protein [Acetobacteraceae bacterium]|nr:zinc ABC transporter substrate-binding protein [Candidatus Parcubacteria bacterium]
MNIFQELEKLNFPPDQYIVVGGAVMAVHGLREANDLDIIVTPELFEKCKKEGWEVLPWTKPGNPGKVWLKKDSVELYEELNYNQEKNPTAKDLLQEAEIIQGIAFITLARLIDFKRVYGRPRDFEDIALMERYLTNHL